MMGRSRRWQAARVAWYLRLPDLVLGLGVFDNQDRVLTGQADQHDEADLGEDVDIHVREGHAGN